MIASRRLEIRWSYGSESHDVSTMETIADAFLEAVTSVIQYGLSTTDSGLTPSDFPEADLTQESLDDVLEEFGELE